MNLHRFLLSLAVSTFLTACGGSGGSGGGGGTIQPPNSPPPPSPPPVSTATLDLVNTGKFGGALLQTVAFGRDLVETVRPGVLQDIRTGSRNNSCPSGGSVRTQLSNDRLRLTETFNNCVTNLGAQLATLSGVRRTVYASPPGNRGISNGPFDVDVTFESLSVSAGGISETIDGSVRYSPGAFANDESQDSMTLNLDISNSNEGTLTLTDVRFDIRFTVSFLNDLIGINGASGQITHNVQGRVDLGYDAADDAILMTGAGTGVGAVQISGVSTVTFSESATAPSTGFLVLDVEDIRGTEFFNESNRFGPLRISQFVSGLNVLVLQQDSLQFSLRRNFIDGDGDLLSAELVPIEVILTDRDGRDETVPADDPRVAVSVTQPEAGIFSVSSATDAETAAYRFEAFVEDPTGLRSLDPLEVAFSIYLDSDLDGEGDRFDDDDDNDTVPDFRDEFPLDPTESSDNDRDGIGDNGDTDDDNDGTPDVDDAYPFDAACFLASDGDGNQCFLSLLDFRSDLLVDRDGVVYFSDFDAFFTGRFTVRRYDTNTGHFLDPFELDPSVVGLTPEQGSYRLSYVESHHALYVSYGVALAMTKIDLTDPDLTETLFRNTTNGLEDFAGRADFGDYAVRLDAGTGFVTFDAAGNDIDTYLPGGNSSDPDFTFPANANFCEQGFTVDVTDGTFFEYTNPSGFNCPVFGEPVTSPDGLLGTTFQLQIFDQSLATVATIQTEERPRGAFTWRWSTDGLFIPSNIGIEVFADDATPITVVRPSGTPPLIVEQTLMQRRDFIVIVFRNSEAGIEILRYAP